ncbi:MAG: ASCH domain-containing protein [Nanoarchaeota archaeon]
MKVLSLKQPFAELVVSGKKTIELRKWNTKFRGEFLIHASKIPNKNAMKKFGFNELPCGFIVGKAKLVDAKKYENKEEHKEDKNKHLADSDWGKYGFILENAERLKKSIPTKGMLGFWNFELN